MVHADTSTSHTYHLTTREFIELCMWHRSMKYAVGAIVKRCNFISIVLYATSSTFAAKRPRVQMMSIVLLRHAVIATERSTHRPCAREMCNTASSFTHESNTCVIRRLAFLNLDFVDLLSCTRSLPSSSTSRRRILVCPRTSKS